VGIEFGMSEHFERLPGVPLARQYEERIRLVQRADEHGFYGYHVSEHHSNPLCLAPSPIVFLSALAQRTSRIRLGTLILILPAYAPLRLLEEICMLDQLSGGRFMPGVGRGVREVEHRWFGLDPGEVRERFDETLAFLRLGLRGEPFSFAGKHIHVDEFRLDLEPLQQPLPFWCAGNLETGAALGMSVIGVPGHGLTRDRVDAYREAFAARPAGAPWGEPAPKLGSTRHVVVAETDEEAKVIARRAWRAHADNVWFIPFGLDGRVAVRGAAGMNVGEDPDVVLARRRALIAGSPETVTEALAEFVDEIGPGHDYLVSSFQWGDITHAEAMRSLDLFATEVMPAIVAGRTTTAAPTRAAEPLRQGATR
jgi:alkanesulfonate monooxygenase SsuD/methylene tetrahydromethanopterin reductase-like flavin-dependent oxidoreductase (luciferase family)